MRCPVASEARDACAGDGDEQAGTFHQLADDVVIRVDQVQIAVRVYAIDEGSASVAAVGEAPRPV